MEPRISFANRMWRPQPMNAYVANMAMSETGWTSLVYGFSAAGYMDIYDDDEETKIELDKLYEDAVSLSLGVFTIDVPHMGPCGRLICNCKIH